MRRVSAIVVLFGLVGGLVVPSVQAQDPSALAVVHARLLDESLVDLERQQILLRENWALVTSGNSAILETQRQGAVLSDLRVQEDELQQLEAQLLMRIFEVQRARREALSHRMVVEAAGGVTASRPGESGVLNGRWDLTVQPGLTGTVFLVQQGTLVSGTYTLSGGWTGSLRGTLVANKVRLERIDSQLGFAAIFYGELIQAADPDVIQGRWEATQLAAGMPSAGGWRAERAD